MQIIDIGAQSVVQLELQAAQKVMLGLRTRRGFIRVVNSETKNIVHEVPTKRLQLAQIRGL